MEAYYIILFSAYLAGFFLSHIATGPYKILETILSSFSTTSFSLNIIISEHHFLTERKTGIAAAMLQNQQRSDVQTSDWLASVGKMAGQLRPPHPAIFQQPSIIFGGSRADLNRAPIMQRHASLSDSGCNFVQSGKRVKVRWEKSHEQKRHV